MNNDEEIELLFKPGSCLKMGITPERARALAALEGDFDVGAGYDEIQTDHDHDSRADDDSSEQQVLSTGGGLATRSA